jgi:polyferredoxin
VAKIGGTVLFGRGWCGYACWTVAILDLLPWKQPKEGRIPYLGVFRYVHFLGSLGLVLYILFVLQNPPELESLRELYWFLIGNLVYYGLGFLLAVVLKDNRAVCKYVCPIPVLQKIGSRFSLMKINIKREKCVECFACEQYPGKGKTSCSKLFEMRKSLFCIFRSTITFEILNKLKMDGGCPM